MVGNRFASAFALAGPAHHTIPTDRRAENSPRDLLTPALALTVALALAAACWAITAWQMDGMNMGPATTLGSLGSFAALWMPMMTAMMLPGATPAVLRHVRAVGRLGAAPLFVVSYLAVWALLGGAVYVVYRPHGTIAAGTILVAAGLYELAPVKRRCRARCRQNVRSGFHFGMACAGSSIGLMAMLMALGIMSVTWMSVLSAVVITQKLLPPNARVDTLLATAIAALGLWVLLAPASVPGLLPAM